MARHRVVRIVFVSISGNLNGLPGGSFAK